MLFTGKSVCTFAYLIFILLRRIWLFHAFCIAQFPLASEFESEWPNGNSVTKQWLNYHSAISEKLVEWLNAIWPFDQLYPNLMNGNLVTVLLLNDHSVVQTQTQIRTELEVCRKHIVCQLEFHVIRTVFVSVCFHTSRTEIIGNWEDIKEGKV